MISKSLRWLGLGVACIACCAPLIAPLLVWAGFGGAAASLSAFFLDLPLMELACAAIAAAMLTGGAYWLDRLWRAKSARSLAAGAACAIKSDPAN
jgi:hypothetical protein